MIKNFIVYFLGGLAVFVTIFLAVDFMGTFVRYEVSIDVLFRYYLVFLPAIIYQMFPVACLLAVLFTLSALNKSSELVALYSMGVSLARISTPILSMVALLSVIVFWLGDRGLPAFAEKKNYILYVDIKKKPGLYSTVKTGKIWYRSHNVLFNIQTLNGEASTAQGLNMYYFDSEWQLIQLIKAKDVLLRGKNWLLKNGTVTLFPSESSFPRTKVFAEKTILMDEEVADIQSTSQSMDVQSLAELRKFIRRNKEAGLETLRYEVDYYAKYGFSFAAFVMSFIGIPFGAGRSSRSGGGFLNIGVCLGLAFVYWLLYSSSITLGKHGYLPPQLAAWGPNGIMLMLSIWLLVRLRK